MNIIYNSFILNNGLRVIFIPRNDNPITSISVFCRVGSRDETSELEGASHFLEHMLFKGTPKRPSPKSISKELDSIGAYFNAYTDKNLTSYIVKVNSEFTQRGIDILGDMMANSLIKEEETLMEKQVVVEEINRSLDNPSVRIIEDIYQIIYKGHPLEHSIGSTEDKILNYNRDKVFEYYKKFYSSNNMVISIVSNLKLETIKKFINKSDFMKLGANNNLNHSIVPLGKQPAPQFSISSKNLEQLHLAVGFPVCDRHSEDRYTLDLINVLLAGNMSSRLFTELREENGLTYNVAIDLSYYQEAGNFIIVTSIDKNSLFDNKTLLENENQSEFFFSKLFEQNNTVDSKKPGALPIILENLKKLKEELVPKDELELVKGYFRGNMVLEKEDSHNLSDYFGKQLLFNYNPIMNFGLILDKYNSISSKKIKSVAKKYFDFNKINISIIGDTNQSNIMSLVKKYQ